MVLLTAHHRDSMWKPGEGVKGVVKRQKHTNQTNACMNRKEEGDIEHAASQAQIMRCEPFRFELLTAEPKEGVIQYGMHATVSLNDHEQRWMKRGCVD
jgi:hypothetical protein